MKLIKQFDIISLLLWSILSFNFIENVNSIHNFQCLRSIRGPVIYDDGDNTILFQSLIIGENTRVHYTPSVLIYAIDNEDVKKAVNCAVESNTDIIARSGGHSYENYGLGGRDGVMVLDVTFIDEIIIDSKRRTAKIGAGNRLGVIYYKLSQAGFILPGGTCSSVGIGGHALGGGHGYFGRKHGLACDNVISMEMVLANGTLIHIDRTLNSDLYFALRGAGASYGIVTHFVVRIHPIPPQVTFMKFVFDVTQVQQLISALDEVGPSLDDGIGFKLRLYNYSLFIIASYLGPRTEAQNAMEKFLSKAPKPKSSEYTQQSFLETFAALANTNKYEVMKPSHHPIFYKTKSFYINVGERLTKDGVDFLMKFLNEPRCDGALATFDLYGGAINNRDHGTAFIHRDSNYCIHIEAYNAECVDEINRFGKEFQSNFTSKYSNQVIIDRELDNWRERRPVPQIPLDANPVWTLVSKWAPASNLNV
ncbi:hypothetical protein RclHR1_00770011 [Rhizophagus clarus]|uniref:FAD-binding PCMH-type domain-containing protein n=1 Tax=Rhizophagus clarus TaxID=94130 RepID=A0A2Z6RXI2_9GLOM|nr:hypothetical protein RclHR1_00770011 [Rhizophagus clarus]